MTTKENAPTGATVEALSEANPISKESNMNNSNVLTFNSTVFDVVDRTPVACLSEASYTTNKVPEKHPLAEKPLPTDKRIFYAHSISGYGRVARKYNTRKGNTSAALTTVFQHLTAYVL